MELNEDKCRPRLKIKFYRKVYADPSGDSEFVFTLKLEDGEIIQEVYLVGPVRFSAVTIMGRVENRDTVYDILHITTSSEIDAAVKYLYPSCKQQSYFELVNADDHPQPYKCYSPILTVSKKYYSTYPDDVIGSGGKYDYYLADTTTESFSEWLKTYKDFRFMFELKYEDKLKYEDSLFTLLVSIVSTV